MLSGGVMTLGVRVAADVQPAGREQAVARGVIRSAWSGLTVERGENPSCELSRAATIHQPENGVQVIRVVLCQRVGELPAKAGGLEATAAPEHDRVRARALDRLSPNR